MNDLIDWLDQARDKLNTALQHIQAQQEIFPGWQRRHFLAHIIGWDEVAIAILRCHQKEEQPEAITGSIDGYNEQLIARLAMLSEDQLCLKWESVRQELREVIIDYPKSKLNNRLTYPWGGSGSVEGLVKIWVEHEERHAQELCPPKNME